MTPPPRRSRPATPPLGRRHGAARRGRMAAGFLALPLLLAGAGGAPLPACAASLAQARPEPPRRNCQGGRDTVAFGRMLVQYGVDTLRYGIGIVLIFLGLVVMALGYLLMLIDLLFCW